MLFFFFFTNLVHMDQNYHDLLSKTNPAFETIYYQNI